MKMGFRTVLQELHVRKMENLCNSISFNKFVDCSQRLLATVERKFFEASDDTGPFTSFRHQNISIADSIRPIAPLTTEISAAVNFH